jgi:tyrosinase
MQLFKIGFGLSLLITSISGKCSTINTRKELRQLTSDELQRFISATQKLQKQEDVYDWFVNTHLGSGKKAHGVAGFLPWHRAFLTIYERALQKIDPKVVLPYWDWSVDAQAPEKSIILSDKYLGGNGEKGTHCVKDGLAKNWVVRIPQKKCLRRDFRYGDRTGALWDKSMIESMISSNNDYEKFRQALEYNPHGIVHDNISHIWGDMNKMVTPNDPIFWMHHAMVDKIWWEWQERDPKRKTEYFGFGATLDDDLWNVSAKVRDVMDTESDGQCYRYERYGSSNVTQAIKQSPLFQQASIGYSGENIWDTVDSIPYTSIPEEYKATQDSEYSQNNNIVIPDMISGDNIMMNNYDAQGVKDHYERMAKVGAFLNANPSYELDTTF